MAKCKKCGADFSEFEETCPYCGTVANIESITDIMEKSSDVSGRAEMEKKEKKSKTRWGFGKKKHKPECKCDKCGTSLYDNTEICPKCGRAPSIETITSILDKNKGE